jgi:ABC-2 type transport system ATP-binding protein
MIDVRGLTKRFGQHVAVDDLTFRVEPGEIMGFLGPNGAGKTTTMRILTGYVPPTAGAAKVAGYDVAGNPMEVRRRIGYLPEHTPLYGEMTVRAYLSYMAELKEVSPARRRERVRAVLELLGVAGVAHRLVGNLSKGYRQRVGLAQAVLADPPVLILDEPTGGLDPAQSHEVRTLIQGLAGHRTVLWSSHILSEVQAVCQRVIIINRGQLVAEDTPDGLAKRLQQARQIVVRVRGETERVERVLSELPGVVSFDRLQESWTEPAGNGTPVRWRLLITATAGDALLEELFYALAAACLPVLELRPADPTLEEIYLALVATEPETDA